jgi:hypothetical protein
MRVFAWLAILMLSWTLWAQDAANPSDEIATQWTNIGAPRQKVLAPLQADWAHYTPKTRHHFMALADKYPTLKPDARERIDARLKHWGTMTKEERILARTNYKKVQQLPPEKRAVVKEQLKQAHAKKLAAKAATQVVPAPTVLPNAPAAPAPAPANGATAPVAATTPAVAPIATKPAN